MRQPPHDVARQAADCVVDDGATSSSERQHGVNGVDDWTDAEQQREAGSEARSADDTLLSEQVQYEFKGVFSLIRDRLSRGSPIAIGRLQPTVGLLRSFLVGTDPLAPTTVVSGCNRVDDASKLFSHSSHVDGRRSRPTSKAAVVVVVVTKSRLMCLLVAMATNILLTDDVFGVLSSLNAIINHTQAMLSSGLQTFAPLSVVVRVYRRHRPSLKIDFCLRNRGRTSLNCAVTRERTHCTTVDFLSSRSQLGQRFERHLVCHQ